MVTINLTRDRILSAPRSQRQELVDQWQEHLNYERRVDRIQMKRVTSRVKYKEYAKKGLAKSRSMVTLCVKIAKGNSLRIITKQLKRGDVATYFYCWKS